MRKTPSVVIVILNWNGKNWLRNCLKSIRKNTKYTNYKIFVVDNGSADGSIEMVKKEFPIVQLICNKENLGFSRATNQGIKRALKNGADYVFLLNNDMEIIQKDWLKNLVETAESNDNIGIVESNTLLFCDKITFSARQSFEERYNLSSEKTREVDLVGGGLALIKREVIEKIGLFDEGFSPFWGEDCDYSARTKKAGYKLVRNPKVAIIHYPHKAISEIDDDYKFFIRVKNWLRLMLLNSPLRSLIKMVFVKFLLVSLKKKDDRSRVAITVIKLPESFSRKLFLFLKACWVNLKNLREILEKRRNRSMKIWF